MDSRTHCGSLSLKLKGRSLKLKLFEATEWPTHPQAEPGLFRLQAGRAWIRPNEVKYAFADIAALLQIAKDFLSAQGVIERVRTPRPGFVPGQRVRWTPGAISGPFVAPVLTTVLTVPVETADGEWRVFLRGAAAKLVPEEPVLCSELTPL